MRKLCRVVVMLLLLLSSVATAVAGDLLVAMPSSPGEHDACSKRVVADTRVGATNANTPACARDSNNDDSNNDDSNDDSDDDTLAPVTVGASTSLLNAFMRQYRAEVEAMENRYVVPQQNMSYGVIAPMPLRDVRIAAMHVRPVSSSSSSSHSSSSPSPSPPLSRLAWTIVNMSLYVPPTNFSITVRPFTCTGVLWIHMNDTTIDFAVDMHHRKRNDTLFVTVNSSHVQWREMHFNHTMNSKACHIAQDVVEVFVGKIDKLAERKIKEQMASALPAYIAANMSSGLAQLPLPVLRRPRTSDEGVQLLLNLVAANTSSSSSLLSSSDHSSSNNSSSNNSSSNNSSNSNNNSSSSDASDNDDDDHDSSSDAPVPLPLPARDVALALPEASLNAFLRTRAVRGQLRYSVPLLHNLSTRVMRDVFPAAYIVCPDCTLALVVEATDAHALRVAYNVENDVDDSDDDDSDMSSPSSLTLTMTNLHVGIVMVRSTATTATATTATAAATDGMVQQVLQQLLMRAQSLLRSADRVSAATTATTKAAQPSATPLLAPRDDAHVPLLLLAVNGTCAVARVRVCERDDDDDDSSSNDKHNDDRSKRASCTSACRAARLQPGTSDVRGVSYLYYALQRVRNVQMRVLASHAGDVDAALLAHQVTRVANVFAVPMLNYFSPVPLPRALRTYIDISNTTLTFGVNVR